MNHLVRKGLALAILVLLILSALAELSIGAPGVTFGWFVAQANVAILFSGHNHYYAHGVVNATTHLTVRTGGAPPSPPLAGIPNIVATYYGTGYTRVEIDGNTLNGAMVGSDGLVKDSFTIAR